MRSLRLFLSTFALASVLTAQTPLPGLSPEEQAKAFAPVTDVPGLPRVLILGDSISIGYIPTVRVKLAGKANVHRPPENCGETARGLRSIDQWLGAGKWNVIHFNFGLHDIKYLDAAGKYVTPDKGKQVATLAEYESNLRALVARLTKTGAKLIFATTTPVPSASSGRVEHDEVRYNQVARRVMEELGVAINDLHAWAKPRQEQIQLPHNVHFTAEGSVQLGIQAAERIEAALH
jgi:acyl-CoA thioesterase-1